MKSILIIALWATLALASQKFEGYQVLRTQPLTQVQVNFLQKLQIQNDTDFWKEPTVNRFADIMVSPESLQPLKKSLRDQGIDYSVMIQNLEALHQHNSRPKRSTSSVFDWKDYHSHEAMNSFIDGLAATNAGWVSTQSIGQSFEGRDMRIIKIEKAGLKAPIAWIEAGIHAREWIASATTTFLINELVNDQENQEIVDNLNIHILPMANPDGYEYSRSAPENRYWRKNRGVNNGSDCIGVDLNRNFGFHWGKTGVSHDPCSEIYCGPKSFSEVESQNIRNYVETLTPIPALGHTIHSYGLLWLWPYGFDNSSRPDNWREIKQLAEDAVDAVFKVNGTEFEAKNAAEFCKSFSLSSGRFFEQFCNSLDPVGGASDDWYKGDLGTRYSFTTELRPGFFDSFGFDLPTEQIVPSGKELLAGMKVVFNKIIQDTKKP